MRNFTEDKKLERQQKAKEMKIIHKERIIQNRLKVFEAELELINDLVVLSVIKEVIQELPAYFFVIPASSSGRYHPDYALNRGGLIRHTKAAVAIAMELLRLRDNKELLALKPYIIAALLVHDGLKSGKTNSGKTDLKHPLLIAGLIKKVASKQKKPSVGIILSNLVSAHMGQWQTTGDPEVMLPYPSSPAQKFVHLCDYLASRNFLEVNFNKINYEA